MCLFNLYTFARNLSNIVYVKHSQDHPGVSYQSMHPKDKKQCKNLLKKIALSPWFYVSSICMLTALAIGLYVWHQSQLKPVDIHRLDVEQCPACFGQSACPAFFRGDVRLRTFFGSRPIHASDVDQWGDLVDVELGKLAEQRPIEIRVKLMLPLKA